MDVPRQAGVHAYHTAEFARIRFKCNRPEFAMEEGRRNRSYFPVARSRYLVRQSAIYCGDIRVTD